MPLRGHLCPVACFTFLVMLLVAGLTTPGFYVRSYAAVSTTVGGMVSQSTKWTLANSPYLISGDVTVEKGATLTIEPGVHVRFDGDFSIVIYGSLLAEGTSEKSIIFTSNNEVPSPGDWNSIKFVAERNESLTLRHCSVEYAKWGVLVQSLGNVTVENSTLVQNSVSGIHLIGESNAVIKFSVIRSNKNGVSSSGNVSSGVSILNNVFELNQNGVYLDVVAEHVSGTCQISNITVVGNTLSSNEYAVKFTLYPITMGRIDGVRISQNNVLSNDEGIYLSVWGGFVDYTGNLIYDVEISENLVRSNEKHGVYVYSGGPWLGSVYNVSILGNRIVSNGVGVYLYAIAHYPQVEFDVVVSNNVVSSNADKGIYVDGGTWRELGDGLRVNMTMNSVSYNSQGVFFEGDTLNVARFNDVFFNDYGANVSGGAVADVAYCFWGDSSGPYHSLWNVDGKGNSVNGNGSDLVFKPFLSSPVVNQRPTAFLEVDRVEVVRGDVVSFNASKSSDDSRVVSYFFGFGDGSNSGWVAESAVTHVYESLGVFVASLGVVDDLGFQSASNASVVLRVQSTLVVSVFAGSLEVEADADVVLTVLVRDDLGPVSDADVSLSSNSSGVFSEAAGKTNSSGYFVTVFHAPDVSEKTLVTISVDSSKSDYVSGQRMLELNVNPSEASGGIDFVWVLAALGLSVAFVFGFVWFLLKRRKHR